MKDLINLWPIGVIVLLLIVSLVWCWWDERKIKREHFNKLRGYHSHMINYIPEDKLPDEGLSPKEKQSFKQNKNNL
jgi:hypothetical protein